MKKTLLLILIVSFTASMLTSCKTHERCPAYGKVNVKKAEKSV